MSKVKQDMQNPLRSPPLELVWASCRYMGSAMRHAKALSHANVHCLLSCHASKHGQPLR